MFSALVVIDAMFAVAAAIDAAPPPSVPSYALDSAVLYRGEVGLALFFGGYLFVAAIALALEGRTVGKISTSGIELPHDLSAPVAAQQALAEALKAAEVAIESNNERFSSEIEALWREMIRLRDNRGARG